MGKKKSFEEVIEQKQCERFFRTFTGIVVVKEKAGGKICILFKTKSGAIFKLGTDQFELQEIENAKN